MSPELDKRSLTLLAAALSLALPLAAPVTALAQAQEPRATDAAARKAGLFEELRTYTPAFVTGAPGADWTHMRVFKLKGFAALDAFSAGMDTATRRVFPDDSKRPRSDELRDLVRQEVWRDFR